MEQVGPALSVTDHESVRRWTMQLAPVNAINAELLDALEASLADAEADDAVAAVVLDSGLKVFSAGADATWMAQTVEKIGPQGLLADFNATMDRFRAVCLRLRQAPFLVSAALDGGDTSVASWAAKIEARAWELSSFSEPPFISADSTPMPLGAPRNRGPRIQRSPKMFFRSGCT